MGVAPCRIYPTAHWPIGTLCMHAWIVIECIYVAIILSLCNKMDISFCAKVEVFHRASHILIKHTIKHFCPVLYLTATDSLLLPT